MALEVGVALQHSAEEVTDPAVKNGPLAAARKLQVYQSDGPNSELWLGPRLLEEVESLESAHDRDSRAEQSIELARGQADKLANRQRPAE